MFNRNLLSCIHDALSDTPVVFIRGARQTGKTTLAKELLASSYPASYYTLDSAAVLSAATADPSGFIRDLSKPVVLDEVQRVPDLVLAIKEDVDRHRKAGRYLLTGSANVLTVPRVADSLAGRMEVLTLWPLSQGEIAGKQENFIEAIFKKKPDQIKASKFSMVDLANRITTGGYPEPVQRNSQKRREAWFDSYLTTIIERDIRNFSSLHDLSAMTRLLRLLASRTAGLRSQSELSRALAIPNTSLIRYLSMLEAIFIIYTLPAWSSNLGSRLIKAPKLFFSDTGIVCHLLNLDASRFLSDHTLAGNIFENFVISEICKQASWCDFRVSLYHFRSHKGHEVDLVIEDGAGKLCGIEIKLTASPTAKHFSGLRELQKLAGKKFTCGILLYTGRDVIPFGNNMYALPASAVWEGRD